MGAMQNADDDMAFETRAIHHGHDPSAYQGAVVPPVYMNVTYAGFAGRPDEWGSHGNEAGAEQWFHAPSLPEARADPPRSSTM